MFERWYSPDKIKYTKDQVIWLLSHLHDIKRGNWPPYPRGSILYTEAHLPKQDIDYKASYEKIVSIANELEARLQNTGQDWLMVVSHYVLGDGYEDLAESFNVSVDEVMRRIADALDYIEGEERKKRSYRDWKIVRIMEKNLET